MPASGHLAIATVLATDCLAKALEPAHETVIRTLLAVRQPRGRRRPDAANRLWRAVVVRRAVAEHLEGTAALLRGFLA